MCLQKRLAGRHSLLRRQGWATESEPCSQKGQVSGNGTPANACPESTPSSTPPRARAQLFLMTEREGVAERGRGITLGPVLADDRHHGGAAPGGTWCTQVAPGSLARRGLWDREASWDQRSERPGGHFKGTSIVASWSHSLPMASPESSLRGLPKGKI